MNQKLACFWTSLFVALLCTLCAEQAHASITARFSQVEVAEKPLSGVPGETRLAVRAWGVFRIEHNTRLQYMSGAIHFYCKKGQEAYCRKHWEEWKQSINREPSCKEKPTCFLLGNSLTFFVAVDGHADKQCMERAAFPTKVSFFPDANRGTPYMPLSGYSEKACQELNQHIETAGLPTEIVSCASKEVPKQDERPKTEEPKETKPESKNGVKETTGSDRSSNPAQQEEPTSQNPPAGLGCSVQRGESGSPLSWWSLLLLLAGLRLRSSRSK